MGNGGGGGRSRGPATRAIARVRRRINAGGTNLAPAARAAARGQRLNRRRRPPAPRRR